MPSDKKIVEYEYPIYVNHYMWSSSGMFVFYHLIIA